MLRGHFAAPRQFRGRDGQIDEGAARAWTWANALCGYKFGDWFAPDKALYVRKGSFVSVLLSPLNFHELPRFADATIPVAD